MHSEWCELPAATADGGQRLPGRRQASRRRRNYRGADAGTAARRQGRPLAAWSGETDLFIYPPYRFKIVDALVTNFHLPRTSLLLLVGAFAGDELLRRAYARPIAQLLPLLQLRRRDAHPVKRHGAAHPLRKCPTDRLTPTEAEIGRQGRGRWANRRRRVHGRLMGPTVDMAARCRSRTRSVDAC